MRGYTTMPQEAVANLPDGDLVEQARAGSSAAFELIVRRHNRTLFRAARGILNDDDLAQEAVQEAYLKAFTSLDSYHGRASLKTWLTRVVVNHAIDVVRRRRPGISWQENISYLHGKSPPGGYMEGGATDHTNPETDAVRGEMKYLLEAAIRRLPNIYRSVFILRDVEGMSTAESAFCLNTSEVLIKKRLSRARRMLREDLLKQFDINVSEIFEFAGRRCDAVTAQVLTELVRRRIIKRG